MGLRGAGRATLAVLAAAWAVVIALMFRWPVFATHDTMISYAHVWYVSRSLWHGHGVPLHMPVLGHGAAYTFPYASVPWLTAAVARPLWGDRTVTLWLVLGIVGVVVATFVAFPELRTPWWAVAVLLNPAILTGALNGQLPFFWAATALLLAVAAWRRDHRNAATALAALANVIHPAIVLPLTALVVLGRLPFERRRLELVVRFAVSAALALPAVWLVFASPVYADTSLGVKVVTFIGTMFARGTVVGVPVILVVATRLRWLEKVRAALAPAAVVGLVITNAILWAPLDVEFGVKALHRAPDTSLLGFIGSKAFVPGATYRLLRASDAKLGMYELLQHGARLDSEFFPEDIHRSSFPSLDAYRQFLRDRHVDFVVIFRDYDLAFHTNERRLASQLTTPFAQSSRFAAYAVRAATTVRASCPSC